MHTIARTFLVSTLLLGCVGCDQITFNVADMVLMVGVALYLLGSNKRAA